MKLNGVNNMIVDDLLKLVEDELREKEITDIRVGLSYIGALLEDRSLGLSYTFKEEVTNSCEVLEDSGELGGDAWELAKLVKKPQIIDSSVGLATINSAINRDIEGEKGPLLDFLNVENGDKIGMVGNFKPVVDKIEKDIELFIFDRSMEGENIYPDWAAEQFLPDVDVAIITGTSVVNKTIDHLIDLSSNAREIAILGPTTPLAPTVFKKRGVTFLGGMVVNDPKKALKIISQGGGTRKLGSVSSKISLKLD